MMPILTCERVTSGPEDFRRTQDPEGRVFQRMVMQSCGKHIKPSSSIGCMQGHGVQSYDCMHVSLQGSGDRGTGCDGKVKYRSAFTAFRRCLQAEPAQVPAAEAFGVDPSEAGSTTNLRLRSAPSLLQATRDVRASGPRERQVTASLPFNSLRQAGSSAQSEQKDPHEAGVPFQRGGEILWACQAE